MIRCDTDHTRISQIGHSLGGALAELDSVFMSLNLPSNIHIKVVTYGKPRVGNPEWAALVNSKVRQTIQNSNSVP